MCVWGKRTVISSASTRSCFIHPHVHPSHQVSQNNSIPFFIKIKSSSPIKYELMYPLQHSVSQIRCQLAECPNEHVRAFEPTTVTEVGIRIVPLSRHSDGMAPHVSAETRYGNVKLCVLHFISPTARVRSMV